MKFDYWQAFEIDCSYHIYNRAVGGELLFRDSKDYRNFLNKYTKYLHPYFHTLAYCLMPNHFHFIVSLKSKEDIEKVLSLESTNVIEKYKAGVSTTNQLIGDQLRRMFSSISISTNNKYGRKGPLFAPRTKRVFINNEDRLRYLIAYVHHNPIHHGCSKNYGDWHYSSYNGLMSSAETLLNRKRARDLYGGEEHFKDFHSHFKVQKKADEIDNNEVI